MGNDLKLNGYFYANGGSYTTNNDTNANYGVKFGGKLSNENSFAKAELGGGRHLSVRLEAGHELKLGKNIGLELAGNAEYLHSDPNGTVNMKVTNAISAEITDAMSAMPATRATQTATITNNSNIHINTDTNVMSVTTTLGQDKTAKEEYGNGYKKAGVSGMLSYKDKGINFKAGVESGYRVTDSSSHAYVTPRVAAEADFAKSKTGVWSAVLDGDKYQCQAGIRFTF